MTKKLNNIFDILSDESNISILNVSYLASLDKKTKYILDKCVVLRYNTKKGQRFYTCFEDLYCFVNDFLEERVLIDKKYLIKYHRLLNNLLKKANLVSIF